MRALQWIQQVTEGNQRVNACPPEEPASHEGQSKGKHVPFIRNKSQRRALKREARVFLGKSK